jgi:hypothetical protein
MKNRNQILFIATIIVLIIMATYAGMDGMDEEKMMLGTMPIPMVPPPPSMLEMPPAWIETSEGIYEKNPACVDVSCDGSLFSRLDGSTFRQAAIPNDVESMAVTITMDAVNVYESHTAGSEKVGEVYGGSIWVVVEVAETDGSDYWGRINDAAWIFLLDGDSLTEQPTDWTLERWLANRGEQ